jgi:hypothetical protein
MIKKNYVSERTITWVPEGWDYSSRIDAIIRNGELRQDLELPYYMLNKDMFGAIAFLQAIKDEMYNTRSEK